MRTIVAFFVLVGPFAFAQDNTLDLAAAGVALDAAQAQAAIAAVRAGDEALTCEQLQAEFGAIAMDQGLHSAVLAGQGLASSMAGQIGASSGLLGGQAGNVGAAAALFGGTAALGGQAGNLGAAAALLGGAGALGGQAGNAGAAAALLGGTGALGGQAGSVGAAAALLGGAGALGGQTGAAAAILGAGAQIEQGVALAAAVEQAVPDAQAEEAEEGRGGRQRGGFMKRIGQGLGAAGALAGGRGGGAAAAVAQAGALAGAADAGGVAAAAALGGALGGQAGIGALSEQATIAQLNQLVAVTPQIMRGVRVSELAQVKGCVWLTQ